MPLQILNNAQVTLLALKESDQEAFQRLLGFLLKPGIDPTAFMYTNIVGDIEDIDYANAIVSVDRRKANIELWSRQDNIQIKYRRTPLQALSSRFGSVIRADLPSTKKELFSIFLGRQGLYDRGDQVIDEVVDSLGMITIEANDGEFLIYGSTEFEIKPFQRYLEDVLQVYTLPGFRVTDDFDTPPTAQLFSQLDSLNGSAIPYPLEPEFITYGVPVKVSGYRYDNTTIEITAFGDGYYLGSATLTYTRYDFGWANVGSQYLVDGPVVPSTQVIINAIADQTGFPISLDDVVIETYDPIPSGEVQTLTVFFKEDNLRYTGELTVDYRAT